MKNVLYNPEIYDIITMSIILTEEIKMQEITNVSFNISEKSQMIWNVADMLRGPFKPHEYGLVILPMTVIKRFHDCLLPTHEQVLETYEKVKALEVKDGFLRKASGYQFFNISKFTFEKLLADPENIEANFRDYLTGFSDNVQDVLAKFDFDGVIKRMVESNTLYLVIKEFGSQKGYLGPDKISAVDCGYIFEDLVAQERHENNRRYFQDLDMPSRKKHFIQHCCSPPFTELPDPLLPDRIPRRAYFFEL